MDLQNLCPAILIWEANLDVDLQSAWSEESFVDQILSVGHSDHNDIIDCLDSVQVGQQLVHNIVLRSYIIKLVLVPLLSDPLCLEIASI